MRSRLKSATMAASFTLCVSALSLSAASQAGEYASATSGLLAASITDEISLDLPNSQPIDDAHAADVTFGPEQEVVQELPGADGAAAVEADTLSELVAVTQVSGQLDDETRCLAATIYYESKGESLSGQLAVAHVVLNRVRSPRFPDSICGVVKQRGQFSFLRGGEIPDFPQSTRGGHRAVAIAHIARGDNWKNPVGKALFFHARRVKPGWGKTQIAAIDNHIFY